MTSSFYPHNKPPEFAYTTKFLTVGHDWRGASYSNTVYPGLYSPNGNMVAKKAIANLQIIMTSARAAELAFLAATGINLKDPNASNIFRNINKILNSKQTFERGLKYMEELSRIGRIKDEKTHTYRDVSSFLETYLNQELKALDGRKLVHMNKGQIRDEINRIIGRALIKTYEQVQDFIDSEGNRRLRMGDSNTGKAAANTATGEQAYQAISDMIKAINELQRLGSFGQFGYLFQISEDNLLQRVKEIKRGKKGSKKNCKAANGSYNEAVVNGNIQGNALELITSTVAAMLGNVNVSNQGLTIVGQHTGQTNQMKADTMLFVGRGNIDVNKYFNLYNDYVKESGYTSVRAQNVYALNRFLQQLSSNIEHVIMISDKNLSIKADFGGVDAQKTTTLKDVGQMLGAFGFGETEALINYLANCGPSMVQGQYNAEIKTELQTMIGYFLFDHLQIHVGQSAVGPNVVNLINVSGLYIPLSAYLEGLLRSLENITGNPSSFVNVSISLKGPTEQSEWTEATWKKFREDRETQSTISYKIMRDIADFITNL